jgi:hypothetical protein
MNIRSGELLLVVLVLYLKRGKLRFFALGSYAGSFSDVSEGGEIMTFRSRELLPVVLVLYLERGKL